MRVQEVNGRYVLSSFRDHKGVEFHPIQSVVPYRGRW